MKKVLIVFDGIQFASGSFNFAKQLNESQPILLTGIFLPQTDFGNLWSYASGSESAGVPMVENVDAQMVLRNVETFRKLCIEHNIEHVVHRNVTDFALPALRKETRFADLLIISGRSFYVNVGPYEQSEYLKEALTMSECPVMVIPEDARIPDSIVLAYEGTKQSLFAIKQFAYLFPEWTNKPTLLVYISPGGEDFPEASNIEELAARHFSDLTFIKLEMNPRKYFEAWLEQRDHPVLVADSFGRSTFSQVFRPSFIQNILDKNVFPVFIAHT